MPKSPTTHSEKELLQARLMIAEANETKKAKKGTRKSKSAKAEDKENKDPKGNKAKGKAKRRAPAVSWTTKENEDLSFTLISIIEASPALLIAFGFDKGDTENNSGGGKGHKEHCCTIARKLFLDPSTPDARFAAFSEDDIEQLKDVVKNRINALKRGYTTHRKEMSETGQGLMDEDKEDEIVEGSEIDNIHKKILAKFPWYKRMHKLMGMSPIVDKSAIANSTTPSINLNMLGRHGKASRTSPKWDIEHDSGSDSVKTLSDHSDDSLSDSDLDIKTPVTPSQPLKAANAGKSTGQKRKGIHDMVTNLTSASRDTAVKIARIKYEEKTRGSMHKEKIKRKSELELELARLEHQRLQGEAQRAHELPMLDRQLQLECLRHSTAGTMLPLHAPPAPFMQPSQPPPSWNFDPNLT
ncbi:hypothetical protein FPV67DRAFT_1451371 [Lyophyllum atratum]|nr:hypothetical protein FPV67DRAFT_1451371 [Lyophyllum atratum]